MYINFRVLGKGFEGEKKNQNRTKQNKSEALQLISQSRE
jgi:hypothetical protein